MPNSTRPPPWTASTQPRGKLDTGISPEAASIQSRQGVCQSGWTVHMKALYIYHPIDMLRRMRRRACSTPILVRFCACGRQNMEYISQVSLGNLTCSPPLLSHRYRDGGQIFERAKGEGKEA
ncbi:hypothetical protein M758_UG193700 [Ceratodon purpureus]|nr:hypothetical protein M758_UG193700 [Ceratodon purpureus]